MRRRPGHGAFDHAYFNWRASSAKSHAYSHKMLKWLCYFF